MFYAYYIASALGLALVLWFLLAGRSSGRAHSLATPLALLLLSTTAAVLLRHELEKVFLILSLGLAGMLVWLLVHTRRGEDSGTSGRGLLSLVLVFTIAVAAAWCVTTPELMPFLLKVSLGYGLILLWTLASHLARQRWTRRQTRRLFLPAVSIMVVICLGAIVTAILHSSRDPGPLATLGQTQQRRIDRAPTPRHAELMRSTLALDAVQDAYWLETETPVLVVGAWPTRVEPQGLALRICNLALALDFNGAQVHIMEQPSGATVLESRRQLGYARCTPSP